MGWNWRPPVGPSGTVGRPCHNETPAPTAEIEAAWATWRAAAEASLNKLAKYESKTAELGPEQWLVLVRCQDEKHQVELLERLQGEGLECKALVG